MKQLQLKYFEINCAGTTAPRSSAHVEKGTPFINLNKKCRRRLSFFSWDENIVLFWGVWGMDVL